MIPGHVWEQLQKAIDDALENYERGPVFPDVSVDTVRGELAPFDFKTPVSPDRALRFATEGMERHHLKISHPCYFGVFNPHPSVMGIVADALVAALNPQLASWTSAPFAIELEQHTLKKLGALFGYAESDVAGTFTQGGTEANHTALLVALYERFPEAKASGLRSLVKYPTLYVSKEAHHSFVKAARVSGLGDESVREIPVDSRGKLDVSFLREKVRRDRLESCEPFFVAGTAGTTSAGVIDPLEEIAAVAREEKLWFHCDAAWGGAAMVSNTLRPHFAGIAESDSITFDAHKWFNVPMTAGVYLTRHPKLLEKTFRIGATPYMPASSQKSDKHQPYAETLGWSRRFSGLKVFLTLAVSGWEGQEKILSHQVRMGEMLREKLSSAGWQILNDTPLPVVCFTRGGLETSETVERFSAAVAATGATWITTTELNGKPCLRAGISNFRTEERHLDVLVDCLRRCPGDLLSQIEQ